MKREFFDINHIIRDRRSIYPNMYTGEPVDEKIILQMLENANWAPSHKQTAPWRFNIFTGEGLKKLAVFQSDLYKKLTMSDGSFSEEKFNMLASKPLKASHIISIGMKRDPKERVPVIEEIEAVACAVQNMYLTATYYGVGCYWGSGGITYMTEALEFFGLETGDQLLGFLYVGTPKKWPRGKRSPIDEKVTWIR